MNSDHKRKVVSGAWDILSFRFYKEVHGEQLCSWTEKRRQSRAKRIVFDWIGWRGRSVVSMPYAIISQDAAPMNS